MQHTIFTSIDNEHAKRLAELDTTHRLHNGTIWSPEDYERRVAREKFRYEQARTAVRRYYQTADQWEHEQTGFWRWEWVK